jgi:tetratricopeptide (TPR) repeat protein
MDGLIRYGQVGQEIVNMAPESPTGYLHLAVYNWSLAIYGKSSKESIAKALKYAQKAISLDESFAMSHGILGNVYLIMRQYEKAIAEGERSLELAPNASILHVLLGNTLAYAGRPDEAIEHLNQGIRLDPMPLWINYFYLGLCYRQKGQYEKALTAFLDGLNCSPDSLANLIGLTTVYVLLNRQEEANAAAKKVLEINPSFSVGRASKTWPYRNQADTKLVADALRKAGLPE